MIAFCILGIWLVWDYRLLGLFAYTALIFCISLSGIFETEVMPKYKEKKTLQAMYWTIFLIFALVVVISFTGWLRPISVAVAKAPSIPSYYDNVVLLLGESQEEVAQLLADMDFQKRRKIISEIDQVGNAKNLYYVTSITSLLASAVFVFFTSMCITKSRLPYIDEAEISAMNARARVYITHKLLTMRIFFCLSGVTLLCVFFLCYVTSKIGLENVGSFWKDSGRGRGNLAALVLFFQMYVIFSLWHFARYPFGLKPNK